MSTSSNNGKAIKTVDDAFKWFERNVARVPDDENADRKSVHPEVRKSVSDALDVEHHFSPAPTGARRRPRS